MAPSTSTDSELPVVFVNPAAGIRRGRRLDLAPLRHRLLGHARLVVTGDVASLERAVRDLGTAPPSRIVICGGDGTVTQVMSALHRQLDQAELPEVSLVATGTVNTLARSIQTLHDPTRTLLRLIEPRRRTSVALQSLLVDIDDRPSRIAISVGAGLVSRFFERYESSGARGRSAAARLALQVLLGSWTGTQQARRVLEPVPGRLVIDGRVAEASRWSLVICSALRDPGLGFRITYRAGTRADHLHLVASPQSARQLGLQAPRAYLGLPLRGSGVIDQLVRCWSLEFPDRGWIVVDGDLVRIHNLKVSAGPIWRLISAS